MKVVIPYRDRPSAFDELGFCLKSLKKHHNGDVYIVSGVKTKHDVKHIHCEDTELCRYENVKKKVLKACDVLDEPFLYMNDDMYLLEPFCNVDYYWGKLTERTRTGSKQKTIVDSAIAESQDGLNYSIHSPMIIEPEIMREIRSVSFKDVHGSLSGRDKVELRDVKIRTKKDHLKPKKFIEGLPFFSTSEFSLAFLGEFMQGLFH